MSESTLRSERRRRFHTAIESPESSPGEAAAQLDTAADAPPSAPSLTDGGVPVDGALGEWHPIDGLARGGGWVYVRSAEGDQAEAKFHQSRRYDARAMKWVPISRWVIRNCGGAYLNWTPVQYRVFDPRVDLPHWPQEAL